MFVPRKIYFSCLIFSILILSCGSPNNDSQEENIEVDQIEKSILESTQILFAYTENEGSIVGELFGVEYRNEAWEVTFDTILCSIGRNGFAEFDQKIEGDGKTPSGSFSIGSAFGYEKDIIPEMDFIKLENHHYWVSDTSSELYNQLIEFNPEDPFSEKMKRNDHLYKYGIIIEYNTKNIQKGKGSAIFMHIERGKGAPTAGCIAMSEDNIKRLINWIKPTQNPLIKMGVGENGSDILNKAN